MHSFNKAHKKKVLKEFGQTTFELRALFRARLPLTDAERLFIENRLMMLHIEYGFWMKDNARHRDIADTIEGSTAADA